MNRIASTRCLAMTALGGGVAPTTLLKALSAQTSAGLVMTPAERPCPPSSARCCVRPVWSRSDCAPQAARMLRPPSMPFAANWLPRATPAWIALAAAHLRQAPPMERPLRVIRLVQHRRQGADMRIQPQRWLLGVTVLAGCSATMPSFPNEVTQARLDQLQKPLSTLADGDSATWRVGERHRGKVTIDSTFQKGNTVCRVVQEDDWADDRSRNLVATYCREGQSPWR